jgi:HEPN domain-containing protein
MKPETADWIEKAEGDWKVARRELAAADPVWHVVCFLAQQCAEKYFKASLEEANLAYSKTHDLVVLLGQTKGLLPELEATRQTLAELTTFGVAARYPGIRADAEAAHTAVAAAEVVRTAIRARLGAA